MRWIFFGLIFLVKFQLFGQNAEQLLILSDSLYSFDPDSSYSLARESEKIGYQTQDKYLVAKAKTRIGRYLILKSDLDEAEKELNAAVKIFESLNGNEGLAYSYKLKAILLKRIGNHDSAIELQEQAAGLYGKANDVEGKTMVLLNLSLDYMELQNFPKARAALNEIYSARDSIARRTMYFYYQNNGNYYQLTGNPREAIRQYEKAKEYAEEFRMTDSYITLLMLMSKPWQDLGNYNAAENYLEESKRLAIKNNLEFELNETLREMILFYESVKKYDKAYEALKEQKNLEKKLYDLEKVKHINELETKLGVAKKEEKIARQQNEIEHEKIQREQIRNQNLRLWFGISGILLISAFTTLLYFRTRTLKNKIEEQKAITEEKQKEILDSIAYAKTLQEAILPSLRQVKEFFPSSFVLYLPKDIVAGDFYWMERVGDIILIAAADCTGHGVPGAMVSVVCSNALNRSVKEFGLTEPGKILDKVRSLVIETFEKSGSDVKDGMDISLCAFNRKTQHLRWAGANNPLWIVRAQNTSGMENILLDIKPDKQPIGKYGKSSSYTTHSVQLEKDDSLYMFTDGYADQFGGKNGKKFKYRQLQETLLAIKNDPMEEQKEKLKDLFESWRGNLEQIDDVLIIGLRDLLPG